jgi:hypothetical protein
VSDVSSSLNSSSLSTSSNPELAEYISYVRTIIDQLTRISLAVRRAGAKYRFERADAKLDEASFEALIQHLTTVILASFEDLGASKLTSKMKMLRASDYSRLNNIQKQLIHANLLRRNRIEVFTKARTSRSQDLEVDQPQERDEAIIETTSITPSKAKPSGVKREESTVPLPPQEEQTLKDYAPSASVNTAARTATDVGSQLDTKDIFAKKASSTTTKMTRIGASQAYPRCPKPEPGKPLVCPYCDDLLPSICSENEQSWK